MAKKLTTPGLFNASNAKKFLGGTSNKQAVLETINSLNTSSSFRYDALGSGFKSTQQVNIDFSKFENHTFFGSATVNTNIAFDKMVNFYPFDGTTKEIENFEDSLTGFERHILDSWPKNKGYLFFSGSKAAAGGSYIAIDDMAGLQNPALSKDSSARAVLDPKLGSLSIEFHLYLPDEEINNQIICQKMDSSARFGYTIGTKHSSASKNKVKLFMAINSGTSLMKCQIEVSKARFEHVAAVFNRDGSVDKISMYRNTKLIATSSERGDFGLLGANFKKAKFLIGSGSKFVTSSIDTSIKFGPESTLTGALDEFRVFNKVLTRDDLVTDGKRSIQQDKDMLLYFRFNEPSGTIANDNSLVLDYSGNSLHSKITNFSQTFRATGSISNPMVEEDVIHSPVLFPYHIDVRKKNINLLITASKYDDVNPNLITRLVPAHYFEEGMVHEGMDDIRGTVTGSYGGTGRPGTGELGTYQLLSGFLYVWAKHFDELKIYIDAFSNLLAVDYYDDNTVSDQFLPFIAKYYGFDLPNLFGGASLDQYVEGRNLKIDGSVGSEGLAKIQSKIWRQVLTNLPDVIRSKGTIHSVKALIRSMGVEPDSSLRIREFGGPSRRSLSGSRVTRKAITTLINFSGSYNTAPGTLTNHGTSLNKPFLISPFLSSSRVEPGSPEPKGSFIYNSIGQRTDTNARSDGLLTSGSWTYEAVYRFPLRITGSRYLTQSLVRLNVTGTTLPSKTHGVIANLILVSGSEVTGSRLTLHARPGTGETTTDSKYLELSITGTNILDGDPWWISFGRQRNDQISVPGSSSYFLRASKTNLGKLDLRNTHMTSSFFKEAVNPTGSILSNFDLSSNRDGPFITIGSQSLSRLTTKKRFLNAHLAATTRQNSEIHTTDFGGQVGHVRFWSKALAVDEWKEHVRNYKSLGVRNPAVNFNFTTNISGSFQKLRLDVPSEQDTTGSDINKNINIFDYSQNNYHLTGSGFEVSASALKPIDIYYSHLSTKIDELYTTNKIRNRSFLDFETAQEMDVDIAPLYSLNRSEEPADDNRFSVDFSVVDALDEDIVKMFGTLEELDNAIGNPELIFSHDYPKLDYLRHVYFQRLTAAVNHKNLFEFFKWFDSNIGAFIANVLPRKTSFLGTNFVIESHMLERPKMEYFFNKIYLGESDRRGLKGTITLTQYIGDVKKF
jgi:hypothetical protein